MEFEAETRERLARIEQDRTSIHRRLDNLESLTESIHAIAVEMREMRTTMDAMKRSLDDMGDRVDEVENRPRKHWDAVIVAAITAIVTFVIGRFVN